MVFIPSEIKVAPDYAIPVKIVAGLKPLGQWSEPDSEIRLQAEQPDAGKLLVLIHEMIHMAETQLIAARVLGLFYAYVIRPIWGEQLVENLSSFLFQWMACSGMLSGITPEEAAEFIEGHIKEHGEDATVKMSA